MPAELVDGALQPINHKENTNGIWRWIRCEIDWERPPRDFVYPITEVADAGSGEAYITLRGIEGIVEAWHAGEYNDGESDEEEVNAFLKWCREYWAKRGYVPEDGISLIYSD